MFSQERFFLDSKFSQWWLSPGQCPYNNNNNTYYYREQCISSLHLPWSRITSECLPKTCSWYLTCKRIVLFLFRLVYGIDRILWKDICHKLLLYIWQQQHVIWLSKPHPWNHTAAHSVPFQMRTQAGTFGNTSGSISPSFEENFIFKPNYIILKIYAITYRSRLN